MEKISKFRVDLYSNCKKLKFNYQNEKEGVL